MTDEADKKVRLFCGARVSVATVRALTDAATEMRARAKESGLKVKWVAPASYHVTLKFLGWSRPEAIEALRDRIGRALEGAAPFEFDVRGAGAFPKPERARVLWAGVDDPEERLADLAARIEGPSAELGYKEEKRAFHPHVTLARLKVPGDTRAVLEPAQGAFGRTRVSEVVLFESVLKSTGSEYVSRVEWGL